MSDGRPNVVLLSPFMTDERVWGSFPMRLGEHCGLTVAGWPAHGTAQPPPAVLDIGAAVDEIADQVERDGGAVDVVVAVGKDAPAAVHLASTGRSRAMVLIDPRIDLTIDFDPADDPDDDMNDESFDQMMAEIGDVVGRRDAAGYGAMMVAHTASDVSKPDQDTLSEMYAATFPLLLAGPTEPRYPKSTATWQDGLLGLDVPLLVVVGAQSKGVHQRMARTVADLAPRGVLVTVPRGSDFPWLVEPDALARVLVEFFADLG